MLWTQAEWRLHSQGKALLELPIVDVMKIGESEPQEFKASSDYFSSGSGNNNNNTTYL
jgi:hypothetical protein